MALCNTIYLRTRLFATTFHRTYCFQMISSRIFVKSSSALSITSKRATAGVAATAAATALFRRPACVRSINNGIVNTSPEQICAQHSIIPGHFFFVEYNVKISLDWPRSSRHLVYIMKKKKKKVAFKNIGKKIHLSLQTDYCAHNAYVSTS